MYRMASWSSLRPGRKLILKFIEIDETLNCSNEGKAMIFVESIKSAEFIK